MAGNGFDLKMVIGGEEVEALSGERTQVIDPATEAVVGSVPTGGLSDVDRAVTAATTAYKCWSRLSPGERGAKLLTFADHLEAASERLVDQEIAQTGKPIKLAANSDIPFSHDNLRYMGAQARVLEGSAAGEYVGGCTSIIRREPLGVVGSIAPWNYPYMMAIWKIGPALAAGNTVVIKPASNTPFTTIELGRIALEAGLPEGVLNVVTGPGGVVGAALCEDSRIAMVSLTGDSATGSRIMAQAAPTVKRLHLELGGKAPFIVFEDADIAAAVQGAVVGGYVNTGQDCTAATRVYVQRSRYDEFVARFVAAVGKIRVGDPRALTTDVGPLISRDQRDRVAAFVDRARADGAQVLTGGRSMEGPGFFYEPTVIVGAGHDSEVVRREIFGPVVVVLPFETEDEVVELGNDTEFGLAASVWTTSVFRALRVAKELESGTVWINDHLPIASEMPHGGVKRSGFGNDMSRYSFEEYTTVKHVMADLTGNVRKDWHFTIYGDAE
jgi:betaine-aldehyde dehydrogenase